MLQRSITNRLISTNSKTPIEYFNYLISHSTELDELLYSLTVNVSGFFRNPIVWEILSDDILPKLFEKVNKSLRIWSAGCASGEEPYSIAIILQELLIKFKRKIDIHVFATDINDKVLARARKAKYEQQAIGEVKFDFFQKYFTERSNQFHLSSEIKKMVKFSTFDLMDKNRYIPPDSIFGNFDIVFCRNVLIYFNKETQLKIFDNLYRSLKKGGYLILGEAEIAPLKYSNKLKDINSNYKIFQRR